MSDMDQRTRDLRPVPSRSRPRGDDDLQVTVDEQGPGLTEGEDRSRSGLRAAGPRTLAGRLRTPTVMWFARRLVVVLLAAVAGMLLGGLYGTVNPTAYEVSGEVQVTADVDLNGGQSVGQVQPGDVATQQALLTSQAVRLAAEREVGPGLGVARSTTASDSSVISLSVTGASSELAQQSLDAYLASYLGLVASQQETQIRSRLAVLEGRIQAANGQLQDLDAAVAAAPSDQRSAVIGQQSAERSAVAGDRLENQQRAARLQEAVQLLPVNVTRLNDAGVEPELEGLAVWQWAAAGGLLGAGLAVLVIMRLAERRRR